MSTPRNRPARNSAGRSAAKLTSPAEFGTGFGHRTTEWYDDTGNPVVDCTRLTCGLRKDRNSGERKQCFRRSAGDPKTVVVVTVVGRVVVAVRTPEVVRVIVVKRAAPQHATGRPDSRARVYNAAGTAASHPMLYAPLAASGRPQAAHRRAGHGSARVPSPKRRMHAKNYRRTRRPETRD